MSLNIYEKDLDKVYDRFDLKQELIIALQDIKTTVDVARIEIAGVMIAINFDEDRMSIYQVEKPKD